MFPDGQTICFGEGSMCRLRRSHKHLANRSGLRPFPIIVGIPAAAAFSAASSFVAMPPVPNWLRLLAADFSRSAFGIADQWN